MLHQIIAVYESMLPRQPPRYVVADDPDAGKTVMTGQSVRELVTRADARRVLVVAPGGLVEQGRDELRDELRPRLPRRLATAPAGLARR